MELKRPIFLWGNIVKLTYEGEQKGTGKSKVDKFFTIQI